MKMPHDLKWNSLVVPVMLFIVMGTANPVRAEQPLTIEVDPCVNIKSAIERLTCYDELAEQAQQTEQPLTIEVDPCVNIKSAIERLTCYDELVVQAQQTRSDLKAVDSREQESNSDSKAHVKTIEQESAAVSTVIQSSPVKEQVAVTDPTISRTGRVNEENFGLPPEEREDEKDLVELHSTISQLREYVVGRYLITLENGQVWRQMVGDRYRLEVGDKVRIYPSRWGTAFRLSAERLKGFIQVERVR